MARVVVGRQPPLLVAPAARRGWRIRARDCLSAAGASSSETPPAPSTAGCGLLGSEPQFTEPSARPEGAVLRTAVKWVSDPNNPQPGVLVRGVRRGTHCAPAALRSNNHGESVDEAGMSCGTPATPRPARPRRIQKGWGANSHSGRRCARPGGRGAQRLRVGGRAQRRPEWMSDSPGSLHDAPRSAAASGSGLAIV